MKRTWLHTTVGMVTCLGLSLSTVGCAGCSGSSDGQAQDLRDGSSADARDRDKDATSADASKDAEEGGPKRDAIVIETGPVLPWDRIPKKCADAAEKGVAWLASAQRDDGRWGSDFSNRYSKAATGFALIKLQTYAVEKGFSPFDPRFPYYEHVKKGFKILLTDVKRTDITAAFDGNSNGKGATVKPTEAYAFGYYGSIVLMALAAGKGTDQRVQSEGSAVNGMSFKELVQDFVDYFASCQADNGGWRYQCEQAADNSVSQYVSLALEYAKHPDYEFLATMPVSVAEGLQRWVASVQLGDGGSGYKGKDGSNLYRTGALMQEMAFFNVGPGEPRFDKAMEYTQTHFRSSFTGVPDTPARYMEMWSVMKGLVTQGIDKLPDGTDWYMEYCDEIVSQQTAAGNWPLSWRDATASDTVLSTVWALLVLEKAAPAPVVVY